MTLETKSFTNVPTFWGTFCREGERGAVLSFGTLQYSSIYI